MPILHLPFPSEFFLKKKEVKCTRSDARCFFSPDVFNRQCLLWPILASVRNALILLYNYSFASPLPSLSPSIVGQSMEREGRERQHFCYASRFLNEEEEQQQLDLGLVCVIVSSWRRAFVTHVCTHCYIVVVYHTFFFSLHFTGKLLLGPSWKPCGPWSTTPATSMPS